MTQISRYVIDTKVTGSDKWIGSDSETQNTTKNFTPNKLSIYFNENQVIDIGTALRYRYDILEPLDDRLPGTITFDPQVGTPYDFSDITNFILSKFTLKGNDVSEYLTFLVGKKVIISKANDTNVFGYFNIVSLIENLLEPNFFDVTLSYITGNGSIVEDNDYFISLVDDPSSGVPNLDQVLNVGNESLLDAKIGDLYLYDTTEFDYGYLSLNDSQFDFSDVFGQATTISRNGITFSGLLGGFYGSIVLPNVTANRTYTLPNASGTIALTSDIPSVTGFVPYIGATTNVQLGNNDITARWGIFDELYLFDNSASSTGYISLNGGNFYFRSDNSTLLAQIDPGKLNLLGYGPGGLLWRANITYSTLTASRTYALPNASGTIALTSNIPTVTPSALTKVDDTNVTLTLGGTPSTALLQNVTLTLGWSGTLADSRIASASTWNAKQNALSGTGLVKSTSGIISYITDNSTNWDTAYTNRITNLTTGGTGAATLISNILNIPTPPSAVFTSLTVLGSSGAASLTAGVLNVPEYTLTGLGGVPTSRTLTINGTAYDLSADRTWSVGTVTSVGATGPITSSGGTTPTISTSMATNKLIGRSTAGTGVMEEITIGTGLSLSAGTLSNTNSGTVTSVGLTMPAAFTVSNSPITGAGTLAVTGAGTASQYIRGDGALATYNPGGGGGGGASVSYYLNGSVSQGTIGGVAYKEMNSIPVIGTGTDFTINADGYIAQFITDAGDPNKLLIPAGNWNFETYFSASSGGGSPRFYIELYKYNGTTFTLISSSSATPENITGGTSIDLYLTVLAVPTTTLLVTDRLAVRFYVIHSGRTITMHTENSHLSQIITTFSTGLTALNGLTAQVQNFATGTSGSDFNISSVTDTHTFNLPTASASNRGALSTTDWSIFNGKQNTITLTNTGSSGASTFNSITGALNIPEYTLSGLGGQPLAINLTSLSGLTYVSTSFVKMTALGTFALDTNTYITSVGTGVANELTYWSGVNTLGSLTTATYPSLTELSYVKGVTSSIQTQLNSKFTLPSLTSGSVLFSNGTTIAQNNSKFFWDNTNNRLGIGINNPNNTLETYVADGLNDNNLVIRQGFVNWGSNISLVAANDTGATYNSINSSTNSGTEHWRIDAGGVVNSLAFTTGGGGGGIKMRISSTGDVGINVNVPTQKLHVAGSARITGAIYDSSNSAGTSGQILSSTVTGTSWITNSVGTVTSVAALTLGTTGTDLSSTVANGTTTPVITLNVPTASATNRGALSSADFTTFSNKFTLPSLTSGSVLFSNGSTIAQDNANFFWDDANNRLGIGTASPNSILEISQATPIFRIQASDTAAFHGIEFRQGASLDAFIKQLPNSGEFRISNGRNSSWGGFQTFYTDTTERMRITSGGNVGIATTSPLVKLQVQDPSNTFSSHFSGNNQTNGIALGTNSSNIATIQGYTKTFSATNNIAINPDGGNVGIGTTIPAYQLDVASSGRFSGLLISNDRLWLNGNTVISNWISSGLSSGYSQTNSYGWINGAGNLVLGTNGSEIMRITSSGNVGIGTSSPNYSSAGRQVVDINGSSQSMLSLSVGGVGKSFLFYTGTDLLVSNESNGAIKLNTNGSEKAIITATGNVGIGTSSPNQKLSVIALNTTPTLSGNQGTFSVLQGLADYGIVMGTKSSGNGWIQVKRVDGIATAYDLELQPLGGNVGIGTTSPSAKLDVTDTSAGNIVNNITVQNASNTVGTEAGVFFAPTTATGNIRGARITGIQEDGNNTIGLKFYTGLGASITEKMRITSTGNVGIGTSSPGVKFVNSGGNWSSGPTLGSGTVGSQALLERDGNYGMYSGVDYTTGDVWHQVQRNDGIAVAYNLALQPSGGNIYIGTNAPIYSTPAKLQILFNGLSEYGLNFKTGAAAAIPISFIDNASFQIGRIYYDATGTYYQTFSDYRLKEDLKPINGLELVSKMKVYDYKIKSCEKRSYGVLAHELQEVVPQIVFGEKDGKEMQGIDYSKLVPILIQAIQDQQKQIDELKTLINK